MVTRLTKTRYLPDFDRLSVLGAIIVLAYTLTRFVNLPVNELAIELPGFYAAIPISVQTIVALLSAGLTASGSNWLLHDHPAARQQRIWQHAMLPALAALILSIPLYQIGSGVLWWVSLFAGCTTLILIVTAEYIAMDPEDLRYPLAAAWLTAVSYALYLAFAITLRSLNIRLFFMIPALTVGGWAVSLRAIHLRMHGEWLFLDASLITLLVIQASAALHYWPLTPFSFGISVLGLTYALTSFVGGLAEEKTVRQAIVEPILVLAGTFAAAVWLR